MERILPHGGFETHVQDRARRRSSRFSSRSSPDQGIYLVVVALRTARRYQLPGASCYSTYLPAPDRLDSPRLVGEQITLDHLDELVRACTDERGMTSLSGGREPVWSANRVAEQVDHWRGHGLGLYVIRGRASDTFLGWAGLQAVDIDGDSEIEVQYAIPAQAWEAGLANELTGELVRIAFDILELPELVAFTRADSAAARRVMEDAGFRLEREEVRGDLPHAVYRIRAQDEEAVTTQFDLATRQYTSRAREGDREAFSVLYERIAPALRAWVRLRTTPAFRARVDPEEVVQETWTRALRRLPELDPNTPIRPWLFRVARFVLIELSRKLPQQAPAADSGSDLFAGRPDPGSGAATRAARADALDAFLSRAGALDERDRELVVLRGIEGRSFDQIAERLGDSAATLGKRWQRLRTRLTVEAPPDYLL